MSEINYSNNSMSTKSIAIIAIIGIMLFSGIFVIGRYISFNNHEIQLRQLAEAQRGKVEANFDTMWKIISQQAQVSNEYKEAFKEIYPELINGRYSQDNDLLVKFVKESNPDFDTSLYKTLMQTIEVQRISFAKDQTRMLDIIREHETLCNTFPGTMYIKNSQPIEYTVISSTKSKLTMETGIDDDVELFK